MIRSCSNCLILAAVFQVIFGHDPLFDYRKLPRDAVDMTIYNPNQNLIPKHCWHPPRNINLRKCCPRPSLYGDEVMKRCGMEPMKNKGFNDIANSKPKGIRKKPCQSGICLMQNANLLKTNESIDYEKLGIYLDEWASANPDFTEAILAAKLICGKEKEDESWYRGHPPPLCDQDKVFVCLMSHMLWNCKLKDFEECQILGEHMKECKPYYYKSKKTITYKFEELET